MDEELQQEPISLQAEEGEELPQRLDRYLAGRLEGVSRSRVQELVKEGFVLYNGTRPSARQAVQPGDRIEVEFPPVADPGKLVPEDLPLAILYEDDAMAALNKPAGLCVHPAPGNTSGTLVHALLHRYGPDLPTLSGPDRPGIVHRLDKDTSGVLVVARTEQAHRRLSGAFAARETRKEYLCVVTGEVRRDAGRIEDFIGRNPGNRQKMAVVDAARGKQAVTDWEVLERGGDFTLIRCRIHTGRTHQIRVHMAYELGHAILGDPVYGKGTLRRGDASRLLLHSWRLGIPHPVTGEELSLEAPVPEAFSPFGPSSAWK